MDGEAGLPGGGEERVGAGLVVTLEVPEPQVDLGNAVIQQDGGSDDFSNNPGKSDALIDLSATPNPNPISAFWACVFLRPESSHGAHDAPFIRRTASVRRSRPTLAVPWLTCRAPR
jgi:hypothetical protein